jgi:medium-chain acyl-[acyl-carrier-protein] hydrolase
MSPSPALEKWLPYRRANPAARVRLVCLPFAGGSAGVFRTWSDDLPLTVEVCAVQPPGRETRFREPPFTRLAPYVTALAGALGPLLDLPLVIFGHSMGALAGFELAREFRRRGVQGPARLIVSGRAAPDAPPRPRPLHTLPDAEFRAQLKTLKGAPASVFDHEELMRVFLPVLRADFAAHETYTYVEEPPLDCPIRAVTGADDPLAPPAALDGWRRHTRDDFAVHVLPGDHFFLQSQRRPLLDLIARSFA